MSNTSESPTTRLSFAVIVGAAVDLVDELGADQLALNEVADRVGTASPSLYRHVDGLPGLRRAVAAEAVRRLAGTLRRAATGRAGHDAITSMAEAYRQFAATHPGLYALSLLPPDPDDADQRAAVTELVEVVLDVVHADGLTGPPAIHAARALRSAIHGFVALEATGGFALDADADRSFGYLIEFLLTGFDHLAEQAGS